MTGQPGGKATRSAADVEHADVGFQATRLRQDPQQTLALLGEVAGARAETKAARRLERVAAVIAPSRASAAASRSHCARRPRLERWSRSESARAFARRDP